MTRPAGRELGNASSLHAAGPRARRSVEESRERIAARARRPPVRGRLHRGRHRGRQPRGQGALLGAAAPPTRPRTRILTSAVEHHAVLDAVRLAGRARGRRRRPGSPVDACGRVDADALRERASPATRRRSRWSRVMWANNEVGTVQPVAELAGGRARARHPVPHRRGAGGRPAAGRLRRLRRRRADRHRAQARRPVGVGALLLGRERRARPLLHGGGQERDVRSGTLDAPGDRRLRRRRSRRAVERPAGAGGPAGRAARRAGRRGPGRVPDACSTATRSGGTGCPATRTSRFPGCEGDSLLMLLDAAGHRVLDRLGLLGRGRPARPRAARDGRRRGRGARLAAVLPRPHLDRRPTSTRWSPPCAAGGRAGPAALSSIPRARSTATARRARTS